jgi:hypothetical protein
MFIIRTAYKSNAQGRGQILATIDGIEGHKRRQRTVNIDLSKSSDWNHGHAAGVLAEVVGLDWHPGIEHDSNDDGTRHGFAWTPPVLLDLTRASIK